MIKVGIVGGTGYTGVELLRLLAQHPHVELQAITSRGDAGTAVADMFPSLRGRIGLSFVDPKTVNLDTCDVVFCNAERYCHGAGQGSARSRCACDRSGCGFSAQGPAEWEKWYGINHAAPELIAEAVYGLPEVNRQKIKSARLVANPGCYPTSVQLGFLPLLESGLVDTDHLIADVKSGVSGAGRKAEVHTLLSEAADNFKAYGVPGHRHLPEIRQGLSIAAGRAVGLTFVPHLTPMIRGIHATLYARINAEGDYQALIENRYRSEPFVDVLPFASHPETRSVRAANICRIALHRPQGGNTLVILSVIDNLVKGAAGQAVQNMNIMCGFDECAGLTQIPVLP